jgi:hypothetical protein
VRCGPGRRPRTGSSSGRQRIVRSRRESCAGGGRSLAVDGQRRVAGWSVAAAGDDGFPRPGPADPPHAGLRHGFRMARCRCGGAVRETVPREGRSRCRRSARCRVRFYRGTPTRL